VSIHLGLPLERPTQNTHWCSVLFNTTTFQMNQKTESSFKYRHSSAYYHDVTFSIFFLLTRTQGNTHSLQSNFMALSQFVSSNSKHQHFYSMQEYLIGEMCRSIPSAYLLTPQPVIFHYYVCTENNTLLTPQSAFLHYLCVYKEITHSSNLTSWPGILTIRHT
jgi:hypothetical protein